MLNGSERLHPFPFTVRKEFFSPLKPNNAYWSSSFWNQFFSVISLYTEQLPLSDSWFHATQHNYDSVQDLHRVHRSKGKNEANFVRMHQITYINVHGRPSPVTTLKENLSAVYGKESSFIDTSFAFRRFQIQSLASLGNWVNNQGFFWPL